jgi:PEP-CTERM motif
MKTFGHLTRSVLGCALAVATFAGTANAQSSQALFPVSHLSPAWKLTVNGLDVTASDQGWITSDGYHVASNSNYLVAKYPLREFNNYGVFSLVGLANIGTITSLSLTVDTADNYLLTVPVVWTLKEVLADAASLDAERDIGDLTGSALHVDLGDGIVFGSETYLPGYATFTPRTFSLNANAIAKAQGLLGTGNFILGGSLSEAQPAVPEPASWALMIFGFGIVGGALRSRPKRLAHQ